MISTNLSGLGLLSPASLIEDCDVEAIAQLQLLAYTDGLTGLLNRRSFDLLAPQQRSKSAFLFVDLDDLKAKNQALGHLISNELLRVVGQVLAANMRRSGDRAFRFGGDEFVAILPECSLEYAVAIAEEIRAQVQAHGGCTVSIGVACGSCDWKTLFQSGDRAAKQAKTQGKNQVVVAKT